MERGLKGVESNGALTLLNANALMLAARYLSGVARRLELTTEEQQGLEQRRRELSRQEASAWLARVCGATPTVRGARDRGRHLITKKTHARSIFRAKSQLKSDYFRRSKSFVFVLAFSAKTNEHLAFVLACITHDF